MKKMKLTMAALSLLAINYPVQAEELKGKIKHVLMVSVDGLHALDVANYISVNPGSALAELSAHGVTYSNAKTPANSDSFPGLLALVTGGSPNSHGLFYDVSYNRSTVYLDSGCATPLLGNIQVYDESIDSYNKTNPANYIGFDWPHWRLHTKCVADKDYLCVFWPIYACRLIHSDQDRHLPKRLICLVSRRHSYRHLSRRIT